MGLDEPICGETERQLKHPATEGERTAVGALARFHSITDGALATFRDIVRKGGPVGAATVDLHDTCAEAGREYQRTIAKLPKEEPPDIADLTCED